MMLEWDGMDEWDTVFFPPTRILTQSAERVALMIER